MRWYCLLKFIEFLFGKPYEERKIFIFFYWLSIIGYFIAIPILTVQAIRSGDWFNLFINIIVYPILFRIVYKINSLIEKSMKMNLKFFSMMIIGSVLLTVSLILITFFTSDSTASHIKTKTTEEELEVSIGELKGYYDIGSFDIESTENTQVQVPYRVTYNEGPVYLMVEKDGTKVWEKKLSPLEKGTINLPSEKGIYDIIIFSEKAKSIKVRLPN